MENEFTLYGVMDKLTGKLVSNITNPLIDNHRQFSYEYTG